MIPAIAGSPASRSNKVAAKRSPLPASMGRSRWTVCLRSRPPRPRATSMRRSHRIGRPKHRVGELEEVPPPTTKSSKALRSSRNCGIPVSFRTRIFPPRKQSSWRVFDQDPNKSRRFHERRRFLLVGVPAFFIALATCRLIALLAGMRTVPSQEQAIPVYPEAAQHLEWLRLTHALPTSPRSRYVYLESSPHHPCRHRYLRDAACPCGGWRHRRRIGGMPRDLCVGRRGASGTSGRRPGGCDRESYLAWPENSAARGGTADPGAPSSLRPRMGLSGSRSLRQRDPQINNDPE